MLFADPVTASATARAAAKLGLEQAGPQLATVCSNGDMPVEARIAALNALADLRVDELQVALGAIDGEAPVALRKRAIALLSRSTPERAVPLLATLLDNASVGERQAAFEALGELQHPSATELLTRWLDRMGSGDADPAMHLDLLEAAAKHEALVKRVAAIDANANNGGELSYYETCLAGGDAKAGGRVFRNLEATRCTRCHSLNGKGGNAGPALDDIGNKLEARQLLEALVTPSARIAEGFGATIVVLHSGIEHRGVITRGSGWQPDDRRHRRQGHRHHVERD